MWHTILFVNSLSLIFSEIVIIICGIIANNYDKPYNSQLIHFPLKDRVNINPATSEFYYLVY